MGWRTIRNLALLLLLAIGAGEARAGEPLTGGDPCSLVERLPGPKAPLRDQRTVRAAFRSLDRAGSDPKRMGRAFEQFEEALLGLLDEAARVFETKDGERWGDAERKRAQRFLREHVLGQHPVLRIGAVGFEPHPGLRAALMWTACRAGEPAAAVRWGRRASTEDEGPARAFAALLLLAEAREAEARELLPTLTGDSFLVSWVRAELAQDPNDRRRHHARAVKRTTTHDQHEAVETQAARLEEPSPGPSDDGGAPGAEEADDEGTP